MDEKEAITFKPNVLVLDDHNRIIKIKHKEIHGTVE
jgi:aspartate 1-decarboxylase